MYSAPLDIDLRPIRPPDWAMINLKTWRFHQSGKKRLILLIWSAEQSHSLTKRDLSKKIATDAWRVMQAPILVVISALDVVMDSLEILQDSILCQWLSLYQLHIFNSHKSLITWEWTHQKNQAAMEDQLPQRERRCTKMDGKRTILAKRSRLWHSIKMRMILKMICSLKGCSNSSRLKLSILKTSSRLRLTREFFKTCALKKFSSSITPNYALLWQGNTTRTWSQTSQ